MSITKNITGDKTSRAYQILINKNDQENPSIQLSYTNDSEYLGSKTFLISDLVEAEEVTSEEVATIEAILKRIADSKNPYKD